MRILFKGLVAGLDNIKRTELKTIETNALGIWR